MGGSVVDKFHLLQREHNQSQSILKNDEQAFSTLRAHKNVIKYFMGDQNIDDILSVLSVKPDAIDFKKLNIMDMSISLNNLLDKINSKQKLTTSEFATMSKTINHRIGYGFMLAPSIILLPNALFKVMFYLASPMYIPTLKKLFRGIRSLLINFNILGK